MRVNEIFYSLQGEGRNTGRAAAFIRLSGCNLRCPFCDTDFSSYREMSIDDILEAISPYPTRFVVLTGGEPTLQVTSDFIDTLHARGYEVAMESNGTRPAPANLDWLTVSPKAEVAAACHAQVVVTHCQELKVLFDGKTEPTDHGIQADYYYLQPLDTGDAAQNTNIMTECIHYIKEHPQWRLSLQTHKLLGIH